MCVKVFVSTCKTHIYKSVPRQPLQILFQRTASLFQWTPRHEKAVPRVSLSPPQLLNKNKRPLQNISSNQSLQSPAMMCAFDCIRCAAMCTTKGNSCSNVFTCLNNFLAVFKDDIVRCLWILILLLLSLLLLLRVPFRNPAWSYHASSQLGTDAASRAAAFRPICRFPPMQRAGCAPEFSRYPKMGYWFLLMGSAMFFADLCCPSCRICAVQFWCSFGLPRFVSCSYLSQTHIHLTSAAIPAAMITVGPATWHEKKMIRGRSGGHDWLWPGIMQDVQTYSNLWQGLRTS